MTKAEAILNKYGVKQSGGAAVSPAAPPSPAPSSTGEKSAQILAKYGVEQKKPETTGAGDRLLSILSGAAKNTAASLADASRAQYEGGQGGRSARNEELLEEYTRGLERAKRDMEAMRSMGESEGTIRSQQNVIDDWQRKYDAMAKVVGENVQQKATKHAAELADEVQVSAQKDINTAKKGLGPVGQFAVDVGAAGAQLAGDVLVNTLLPGMGTAFMGYRAFGSGTQEARQSGAELNEQLAYGAGSATLATAAEKIANVAKPFRKAFGGGVLDDAITKAMGKLSQSAAGKLALSALSEGGEEFVEAILQPVLQRATYDPDAKFDLSEALYQAAIGAALGGAGGGVDVIASRKTGTQAQNTPPNPAAQRTAQSEGVDTARSESPAEAPAAPFAQAVSTERTAPAQDTLLASVVKSMQPVTNKQAEALLADAESAVQLGIDTNGMTRSQQRAAVKEKVRQMQLTIPGKEIYKRPDPLTQILFGREEIAAPAQTSTLIERTVSSDISTSADVETQNSFDAAAQASYTGIERSAVSQGIADKYGVVLDEAGRGRNKTGKRSTQAQSVVERAARGEVISLEELNAIPEVAMALEEVNNGVETYTLPGREGIVQDGIRRALERGSYSGKGPDGKDTFNGEVRRNRRIDIVTGVAGSGKSSVYSNRISGEQGSRIIDTDDYRDYIPEYNGRNAALVHEESSSIKKGVLAQALTDGENILLSVVGDNAEKLAREILAFKRAGYEVHLHLNHLPNEKSVGRVIARYVNEEGRIGRLVAPEIVKKMGDGPMQAYLLITGQGGAEHADTGREQTGSTEDRGDRATGGEGLSGLAGSLYRDAGAALASYDAFDNDVPFGAPARFLADISRQEVKSGPASSTVGAAAVGFQTPGSQGVERTSKLAEHTTPYTGREGEATARTREEYDELFRYQSQTEEQSMQEAQNMLYLLVDGEPTFLMDYDPESYQAITESLRLAPAWNGIMTDTAMMIKQELMARSIDGRGNEDTYVEWLQTMREHATAGGQGTQAWAKWSRTDNEAGQATELEAWENLENSSLSEEERQSRFQAIVMFDRRIEQDQTDVDLKQVILDIARERGTLSGLTGKQSRLLTGLAEATLDGMDMAQLRQFAYSSSAALSTDTNGANAGEKIKTIQILNMLSNPKTPAKNLAGNTSFYALDAMTMRGAALLDMVLSRITGTRSVAMEGSVLNRESRDAISQAIRMSLAEVTMDVDMGSGNRYQHSSNRTFKAGGTGVLNTNTAADRFAERVLSAIERNMGYLMTTTDEAYKGAARSTAAATQRLVETGKVKNAGRDYARDQAESLARYRTFQNDGRVAAIIRGFHDLFNIAGIGDSGRKMWGQTIHSFGLGDLVAPFTRVAGNLAAVGLDYSPANAVKGTVEILNTVRRAAGGSVDPTRQAKAVSDFARGMSGSAIAYGVMVLAKAGMIKRAEDEEDEDVAALNQSEGMTGTQVNIDAAQRWLNGGSQKWQPGDTLIDMSNLEPLNFILSLGVEMADNGSDSFISTFGDVETYQDTATGAVAAAGDLPILSGVGDFAKDVMVYHNDPVEAGAEMLGKTAISSVTPNILAAFAKGWDEKQRNVYSGDGVADVLLDTVKSRIPGLREQLPTTVNTLGEEKDNPGTLTERLLNAMLNPIGVNQYSQSEVSREMERVREETGETGFYPTTRKPKELTWKDDEGKTHEVTLDYDQQQKFQAACSAVQMSATADMIGSSLYKRADADEQSALLKRCYDYAYQFAKAGILGDDAVDSWVVNAPKARQELGISTTDFLYYYEKYGSGVLGGSSYDKTRRMVEAGLTIDQWAAMKNKVDADGNGSVKKVEVTDYIEANFPKEKWSGLFDAYKGGSNWKNPY